MRPPKLERHTYERLPYAEALVLQRRCRGRVLSGESDGVLLLLQHPPTLTLGRHGQESNVLAPALAQARGCEVVRTDRGGDVTFHGPGQLVGYPIISLARLRLGVRGYIERLASVLADVLAEFGVAAAWDGEKPGLWVGRDKIVAFGVHVHRQVTTHGFALNVSPDLSFYELIVPCGLADRGVTSMATLLGTRVPAVEEVAERVAERFAGAFNFEYNRSAPVQDRPTDSCEGEEPP